MPATSEKQRRLFGAALSVKRRRSKGFQKARKLASQLSEGQLREFAAKKK